MAQRAEQLGVAATVDANNGFRNDGSGRGRRRPNLTRSSTSCWTSRHFRVDSFAAERRLPLPGWMIWIGE